MKPILSAGQRNAMVFSALAFLGFLSAAAEEGHPAHYLVFEVGEDGFAVPLFHRAVELGHRPEPMTKDEMLAARSKVRAGEKQVAVEIRDANDEVAFLNVIQLDPWFRGEFPGARQPGGGWRIESHRFPRQRQPFVVRVPRFQGARLMLDGAAHSVFDLDSLAASADSLPLAHVSSLPLQVKQGAGDSGNRVDLLIMGDGYTSAGNFAADAAELADSFFAISPYSDYANYVKIAELYTESPQSGADHPPYDASCVQGDLNCCADPLAQSDPLAGTYVETAFNGRFCASNLHRLAVVDEAAALAVASATPDWDHILMLLNDDTYGGSGGNRLAVSSTHPLAVAVARHEYGHSFTGLADEYEDPYPNYPPCSDLNGPACEPNVTDETSASLIKWAPWIDPGTPIPTPEGGSFANEVGLFEGARYLADGMYRPRDEACLMRTGGVPFCEICAQSYLLRLYQGGWGTPAGGIDPIEPGSEEPPPGVVDVDGPISLSVDLLAPIGGPALDVGWWVDGVWQGGVTGDTFVFVPPTEGIYLVEIRVEDVTSLVHPAMAGTALRSQRTWNVTTSDTPPDGPSAITSCTAPSLELVDSGSVDDQMSISMDDAILDLNVTLDVTHTFVGDLTFTLENVGTGTRVTLVDRPAGGGCAQDDIEVILDDEAASPVADQCASSPPALDGSFSPVEPLSAFDGESVGGPWKLTVTDSAGDDTGTLNEWCLWASLEESDILPISPLSGLIVPGFEVDVDDPDGRTTLFAARNTSDEPIDVKVAYYGQLITDQPLRTDAFTLEPQQTLAWDVKANLNSLDVAGGVATGLIIVSEGDGTDASNLQGDYFRLDSGRDFATGDRLVRAEDFCTRQEIRFVDFGSGSEMRILIDHPQNLERPSYAFTAYNQTGAVIKSGERYSFGHLEVINVEDLVGAPRFGTVVFDFSNAGGGFVTAKYSAFGRYSVELNSACLD